MQNKQEEPKLKKIVDAAQELSLGGAVVVAILLGVGLGIWLKKLTGHTWTLWIGVFIGVGAAINNVYIAYKKQKRSLDELAKDPRYRPGREIKAEEDEDDERY